MFDTKECLLRGHTKQFFTNKMAKFKNYYLVVSLVVAFFCAIGFIVMVTNMPKCPTLASTKCPAPNGYPATDRSLPDLATPSNPTDPVSLPDISLERDMTALNMINIYESDVKRTENNFRKPQGRMFPLTSSHGNDEEAVPGIPEGMITILSSMVYHDSHPIVGEKMKTAENKEFEAKMTNLMSSIVSSETNPTLRWSIVNTLSSIVSAHGIEPDIWKKMNQVLYKIVDRHETDQQLKLEMAKLMSSITAQESDDSVKWKMLNTLLKIASLKTEMEIKSKLITILSAISNEKYSPEIQFKTANSLSAIVDRYGIDETRTQMERLLSRIVPPAEKFAIITKSASAIDVSEKDSRGSQTDTITSEDTQEEDANNKVEMINILSKVVDEEKALKVASQLSEFAASINSSDHPQFGTAMADILSRIISENDPAAETVPEAKNHSSISLQNLDNEINDIQLGMGKILSEIVSEDQEETPETDLYQESESLNAFLAIIHEDEVREAELARKSETNRVLATLVHEKKTPESHLHQKSAMMNILLDITNEVKASVANLDKKAEMLTIISEIVKYEKTPEEDFDVKSRMVNLVSDMVHDEQPSETDVNQDSERMNTLLAIIQEDEIREAELSERSGMIKVLSKIADGEKKPEAETEEQLELITNSQR